MTVLIDEKNVEVVLTSGRPIMSVKNLANELGCNNYMICGNGAITYDIQNEEIIYNRFGHTLGLHNLKSFYSFIN